MILIVSQIDQRKYFWTLSLARKSPIYWECDYAKQELDLFIFVHGTCFYYAVGEKLN